MGPNLLNADAAGALVQLASHGAPPNVPVAEQRRARARADLHRQGALEGVRGDIAFVQSMLETGWFSYAGSQIPPDVRTTSPGINAYDGRARARPNCKHGDPPPSRCFATPQIGVRTQIQLLRELRRPDDEEPAEPVDPAAVGPRRRRADLGVLRRQQLPVRQAHLGAAPTTTASASSSCTRSALVFNGVNAACVPYFAGQQRAELRQRLLGRRPTSRTSTRSATARVLRRHGDAAASTSR